MSQHYFFHPHSNSSEQDSPRLLTNDEIEHIIENFPTLIAASKEAATIARKDIQIWLKNILKNIEICPSAIEELINIINKYHYDSLLIPGTTVGTSAAEAIGASSTQGALKTFHAAGSSKSVTAGIDAMKEIIDVKIFKKNEVTTLIMKNRFMTFLDVLNLRKFIVGSKMSYFITDYKIFDNIKDDTEGVNMWWKPFFSDIPDSKIFLRLFINVNFCYKHGVTISQLAEQLESHPLISSNNEAVKVVHSPMSEGIIDIYPTKNIKLPEKILKNADYNANTLNQEKFFLLNIVYPAMKKLTVKGIENVKSMDVISKPLLKTLITNIVDDNIYLNKKEILNIGISIDNLNSLISRINKIYGEDFIELFETDNEYIFKYKCKLDSFMKSNNMDLNALIDKIIKLTNFDELIKEWRTFVALGKTPEGVEKLNIILLLFSLNTTLNLGLDLDPLDYDNIYLNIKKLDKKTIINKLEEKYTNKESILQSKSEYVYIEAYTDSNLKDFKLITKAFRDLIKLQFVDINFSYSNNINIMSATLGIEAARNVYIRELNETIKASDSYINPSHYMYVADFVTSLGFPSGATSTALNKQGIGHLSRASYAGAMEVLTKSAIFNIKEDIRGVSASIITGAPAQFGTKYFDIGTEVNGVIFINDAVYTNFENKYTDEEIKTAENKNVENNIKENDINDQFDEIKLEDLIEPFSFPDIIKLDKKYYDADYFNFF